MARYDLPVWMHRRAARRSPTTGANARATTRSGGRSAGPTRPASRWRTWCSAASTAIPVKLITHHMGGMIPYFEGRVGPAGTSSEHGHRTRTMAAFKSFKLEQATNRRLPQLLRRHRALRRLEATKCGLAFFGVEKTISLRRALRPRGRAHVHPRDHCRSSSAWNLPAARKSPSTRATCGGCAMEARGGCRAEARCARLARERRAACGRARGDRLPRPLGPREARATALVAWRTEDEAETRLTWRQLARRAAAAGTRSSARAWAAATWCRSSCRTGGSSSPTRHRAPGGGEPADADLPPPRALVHAAARRIARAHRPGAIPRLRPRRARARACRRAPA